MTIIAERLFEILREGQATTARIVINAPIKEGDEEWSCKYELQGFSKKKSMTIIGVDSFQVINLAMKSICSEIAVTEEYKAGVLALFGERNFDIEQSMGGSPLRADL